MGEESIDLKQKIIDHKGNVEFFKTLANDPVGTIQTIENNRDFSQAPGYERYESSADPLIYHVAIGALGFVAIGSFITIFLALFYKNPPPSLDGLIALGSASIGALAGMLVPQQSQPKKI